MRIFDNDIRDVKTSSYKRGEEVTIEFEDGRALVVKMGDAYDHPDGGARVDLIEDTSNGSEPPVDSVVVDPNA